ncbi:MAG: N-acetylmuramoyl-L-alanine amidase [Nocardioidaceae bacterium]
MKAPAPRYIGPPRNHGGASNKPIHRIVMHSTVSPCEEGGARNIAHMFETTTRDASAHYIVDPGEVIQGLYDSYVGYHAPPNQHSLGVEMCEYPKHTRKSRWFKDKDHVRMLKRAAKLVAQLCLAYDVPIQWVGGKELREGKHGITGHANVSWAWHETTHWDPGAFPHVEFVEMVQAEADKLQGKPAKEVESGKPRRRHIRKLRREVHNNRVRVGKATWLGRALHEVGKKLTKIINH